VARSVRLVCPRNASAKSNRSPAHQAQPDPLVRLASPVSLDHPASEVNPDSRVLNLSLAPPPNSPANAAPLAHLVSPANKDPRAPLAKTDNPALQDKAVDPAQLARPDPKDSQDSPAHLEAPDSPETPEPMDRAPLPFPDHEDHADRLEHPDNQASQETPASPEARAHPDLKDNPAAPDSQVNPEPPVSPDNPEDVERTPLTARALPAVVTPLLPHNPQPTTRPRLQPTTRLQPSPLPVDAPRVTALLLRELSHHQHSTLSRNRPRPHRKLVPRLAQKLKETPSSDRHDERPLPPDTLKAMKKIEEKRQGMKMREEAQNFNKINEKEDAQQRQQMLSFNANLEKQFLMKHIAFSFLGFQPFLSPLFVCP
jgi:hypothetical protein